MMIVVMKKEANPTEIASVVERIKEMGLTEQVITGTELTVIAAIGDDRKKDRQSLESLPGVERVMEVLAPYKRASVEVRPEPSAVRLNEHCVIGGRQPVQVIAGPCSVESAEQIMASARIVKAAGATALRGGAFKPRTNPYSFQGHGEDGLKMLAAARAETGLAIVTEVVTPGDVELVSRYADCLQIGTRNAQNYELLKAAGQQPKPVLLKRGMWMEIDEYLLAAEYILDAGNEQVILCERGIRTFEKYVRNTFALALIPELKRRTHLPVIADPSHGTGHTHLVAPMSYAAVACGADALAVEVHPDPPHALTDGGQSMNAEQFEAMMSTLAGVASSVGRSLGQPG